jgi:hypothetical protein
MAARWSREYISVRAMAIHTSGHLWTASSKRFAGSCCSHAYADSQVSKPFFVTLQRWIFSGELHDPFQEFFVQLNPDMSLREGRVSPYVTGDIGFEGGLDQQGGADEAHKVWEKKYVFVKGMVPGFVSEEFGRKVSHKGCERINAAHDRYSQPGEA